MSIESTQGGHPDRKSINMARMACDGFFLELTLLPIADGFQVTSIDEPSGDDKLRLAGFYWSQDCYPVAAISLPGPAELPQECTDSWFEKASRAALGAHADDVLSDGFDQVFCQMGAKGTIVSAATVVDGKIGGPWIRRPRPMQRV